MKINVLTLYPEVFQALNYGILGRAIEKGLLQVQVSNIRDYSKDKHKKCDDYPFGGGAGMIMTPQPLYDAIVSLDPNHIYKRIYLSPKGKVLNQDTVKELAICPNLMLINGCYEGVDQRVIDSCVDMELSIGDYILTSGDYATLVLINAISRNIEGVLGNDQGIEEESFSTNLLEYPQYTRPQRFRDMKVPTVLLSGNHSKIAEWRKDQSVDLTKKVRPELLEKK